MKTIKIMNNDQNLNGVCYFAGGICVQLSVVTQNV